MDLQAHSLHYEERLLNMLASQIRLPFFSRTRGGVMSSTSKSPILSPGTNFGESDDAHVEFTEHFQFLGAAIDPRTRVVVGASWVATAR